MSGSAGSRSSEVASSGGSQDTWSDFTKSVWNGLQSYLAVCLVLTSLFFIAAAVLTLQVSVIFGIIGLWVILLDWAPTSGLLRRVGRTVIVSAKGNHETEADRMSVLLRIGGAALVLWAIATGMVSPQPESAPRQPPYVDQR